MMDEILLYCAESRKRSASHGGLLALLVVTTDSLSRQRNMGIAPGAGFQKSCPAKGSFFVPVSMHHGLFPGPLPRQASTVGLIRNNQTLIHTLLGGMQVIAVEPR
jgi:hypothetical protein